MLLKNLVILKIDWGVDAIYKVLDNKEVENQKGFFTDKSLIRFSQFSNSR